MSIVLKPLVKYCMKQYEFKKVENCFSSSHVYEYRLTFKTEEEFLECFNAIGSIKYYRNFPRPCFQATLKDGTTVKGVIADWVIKVSFPDNDPQGSKEHFEIFLEELLMQQMLAGRDSTYE